MIWRGTQVVRERSAKPLCAGSNPARASAFSQMNNGNGEESFRLFGGGFEALLQGLHLLSKNVFSILSVMCSLELIVEEAGEVDK